MTPMLIEPADLLRGHTAVLLDCRFSLSDPHEGENLYRQGHIPGAHYLDLNRDLAVPPGPHGGRHPLPDAAVFATRLAQLGIGPATQVIAYDDSRLAFAARLWWMMRALGYRAPQLLNGGYRAFLQVGGKVEHGTPDSGEAEVVPTGVEQFQQCCDRGGLAAAQAAGALLVDSREPRRYAGIEEPIDPVAGHIPGAVNRPWQGVTDEEGRVLDRDALLAHWGDALDSEQLVVYCGSGVTACVNLFSLALLGREDATLYSGSWSDWCSYL